MLKKCREESASVNFIQCKGDIMYHVSTLISSVHFPRVNCYAVSIWSHTQVDVIFEDRSFHLELRSFKITLYIQTLPVMVQKAVGLKKLLTRPLELQKSALRSM